MERLQDEHDQEHEALLERLAEAEAEARVTRMRAEEMGVKVSESNTLNSLLQGRVSELPAARTRGGEVFRLDTDGGLLAQALRDVEDLGAAVMHVCGAPAMH